MKNKNEISRIEGGSWGNFFLFSWWSREQSHWEYVCWFMLGKFFCGSPERSLVWDGAPDIDKLLFIRECKIAVISTTVGLGWNQFLCTFDYGCIIARSGGCLVGCNLGSAVGKFLHPISHPAEDSAWQPWQNMLAPYKNAHPESWRWNEVTCLASA